VKVKTKTHITVNQTWDKHHSYTAVQLPLNSMTSATEQTTQ